eukprot:gene31707-41156_t
MNKVNGHTLSQRRTSLQVADRRTAAAKRPGYNPLLRCLPKDDDSGSSFSTIKNSYDHLKVEAKWQSFWEENNIFKSTKRPNHKKKYVLDMFPYPSGSGLHVGHPEGYTATDIMSRYWRMLDYDVLHPMGWDAFGLPAEQHAMNTGTHPKETTLTNIGTFKRQLKSLGFSYDWSRELSTTDEAALEQPKIRKFLEGGSVKKTIYVPGKILNILV